MAKIDMRKMAMPVLLIVLAIALVVTLVVTIPSANEVETADDKIGYTYYATTLNVERLEIVANNKDNDSEREYVAVLYNNEVTMMINIDAKQYMLLHEGDVVSGHLVVLTNGNGAFTFAGKSETCDVVCYEQHKDNIQK
jgi:hypothetical protein